MSTERKICLLNPGPVTLTRRVRQALLRPDLCHREAEFAALQTEVRERLGKQGLQLPLGSPEEFAALIAAESKRWGEVIRTGGIKLESN